MTVVFFVCCFLGECVHDVFHQVYKLVGYLINLFYFVFFVFELLNNNFVISRYHFSLLAYIYLHKYIYY